jgi:two-component system, OmpR family, response regulator
VTDHAVGIAEQVRPATAHPGSGPPRPRGVLVVDDQEPVRRVLSAGMWSHGFAVWLAAGGAEAVEVYRRHRDLIDVVLLDVQMPGLDGPATLAALRETNPGVCCCFMTGDSGRYTEQTLAGLGAVAVFRKPLRLREVAQQLVRLAGPLDCGEDEVARDDRWRDDGGPG